MAKIFIAFNIVSTSDFLMVVRENSNLLAEVYRSDLLEPPHSQRNITVDNLNPVMHTVQFWTTVDGTTLGELRGQCEIDASIANTTAFDFIQFIVDRGQGAPVYDPASGQDQYVNPDLVGKDYVVFKPGFGALTWDVHIQELAGGGFEFINGTEFENGEEYTIMINNLVTSAGESNGNAYPNGIVEFTGDITFGTTHYNKLLEANCAGDLPVIDIPSIDAIPDNTVFGINTHNGSQRYVTVQLDSGKYCLVFGQQRNAVYIGKGEEVTFIKKGAYLRIVSWDGDYRRLGDRVFTDGNAPVNSLPETGGWYLKTDYPRLYQWYIDELPVSNVISGTDDVTPSDANKGKWNVGSTKFWVPDRRNRFDRNTDGTRVSGDLQFEDVTEPTETIDPIPTVTLTLIKPHSGAGGQIEGYGPGNAPGSDNYDPADWPFTGDEVRPTNIATNVYRII